MSTKTTSIGSVNNDIDVILKKASASSSGYRKMPVTKRASFLDAIASEIENLGDSLIRCANEETHIPEPQLISERTRTVKQLRVFADMIREGSWVQASIDTGIENRQPLPKPDLRSMLFPLGPVVVFGASNFPFAYSTAGGDTASALAAGCPVIVKAHPAHARTSLLVASAISRAVDNTGMPPDVFQHVNDESQETGRALVTHPLTAAVGFTGSFTGGKALFDLANRRDKPIPVFCEMGSANPVCILPEALKTDAKIISEMYVRSITTGMGQFCTKPGLQLVPENEDLENYVSLLSKAMLQVIPAPMLHPGIAASFEKRRSESILINGVRIEATVATTSENFGVPTLASVSAEDFLLNPVLHTEVFGPYSLIIRCTDRQEMLRVICALEGQLTATIMGTEAELENNSEIIEAMTNLAGRVIINGVPTGVEVCHSIVHGGPYPATTDPRFTAVGLPAIRRFLRPVCFQNFPIALLPEELQPGNPRNIWRMYNGAWTKAEPE